MTRIVLALSFPLRYYAFLTAADSGRIAAAPLQEDVAAVDGGRNDSGAGKSEAA